jgi:DNA polymerase elongation subunit (family B)
MSNIKTFIHNGVIQSYQEYETKYIIAGDTDSAYIDLGELFDKETPEEDVIKFADEIGAKTNDAFPDFMLDVFNSNRESSKVIQTEREVVSDKSYFLGGKKMYVMHIINNEGITIDKLKIMGVAIKKSDTPKIIQDFLRNLVEMLMDKESYENVRNYVDSFNESYYNKSFLEIGKPMGIKSLKKYEVKYEKVKNMKGFPYHVRAAMNYNSLCGMNDKKIVSGDKIRIVYLKHPKFKYIAVPVDIDVLPSFIDNLVIDWMAQWNTVVKKINIFLEPIGYDRSSRQKKKLGKLLVY